MEELFDTIFKVLVENKIFDVVKTDDKIVISKKRIQSDEIILNQIRNKIQSLDEDVFVSAIEYFQGCNPSGFKVLNSIDDEDAVLNIKELQTAFNEFNKVVNLLITKEIESNKVQIADLMDQNEKLTEIHSDYFSN